MQTGGRRGRRPRLVRIDRLVALGIRERLVNVRRQRCLAGRLAARAGRCQRPAPIRSTSSADCVGSASETRSSPATSLLDGRASASQSAPSVRSISSTSTRSTGRAPQPQPCGDHPGVVDDDELAARARPGARRRRMTDLPVVTTEDEQPRSFAAFDRMLSDQLRRELVVELETRTISSDGQSSLAGHGRRRTGTRQAAHRGGARGSRRATASGCRARAGPRGDRVARPRQPPSSRPACRTGSPTPCRRASGARSPSWARNLAEIRGLLNNAIRRLERLEQEVLAERHARIDDLALLVDLVSTGWRSVDARLEQLERPLTRPAHSPAARRRRSLGSRGEMKPLCRRGALDGTPRRTKRHAETSSNVSRRPATARRPRTQSATATRIGFVREDLIRLLADTAAAEQVDVAAEAERHERDRRRQRTRIVSGRRVRPIHDDGRHGDDRHQPVEHAERIHGEDGSPRRRPRFDQDELTAPLSQREKQREQRGAAEQPGRDRDVHRDGAGRSADDEQHRDRARRRGRRASGATVYAAWRAAKRPSRATDW